MGKYEETLDWMFKQLPMFQRQGPIALKLDLSRIKKMMDMLGNPHQGLPFIHIAGTNGKGTTGHIIASILQASGFQVGMYTSPHYVDFRERIKINGALIDQAFIIDFVDQNKTAFEAIQPSFFEWTFALSIVYFKAKSPDFIVLETGMGGRLDSTNVVDPLISLITNIGYDHQQFLGDTLVEIAFEKGGIIKPFKSVVIGERQSEIQYVFEQLALEQQSKLVYADQLIQVNTVQSGYEITGPGWEVQTPSDIKGPFAHKNIQSVLACLQVLQDSYPERFKLTESNVKQGLSNVAASTHYIGRWMQISDNPLVIMDSAHNLDGIKAVLERIDDLNQGQLHIVLATVGDKDASKVLQLFPKAAKYYYTQAKIPRAKPAVLFQQEGAELGLIGNSFEESKEAYQAALKTAQKEDTVIILGSVFLIAELL